MRESSIEKYLKTKIIGMGGLCWKFVSPGTIGVPDRIVIHKGKVIFVELKAAGQKPRAIQMHRAKQLDCQNCPVIVIDSKADVDRFVMSMEERNEI